MQTRRTSLDHHHQEGFPNTKSTYSSPEAELIALARSKGQPLTEYTLRLIGDTLELRGVTLEQFVAEVRPHFRNNIFNPSGFLINRARHFLELSRPAQARAAPTSAAPNSTATCTTCKGQKLVMNDKKIEPCPECSTPEFRRAWDMKEAQRAQKAKAGLTASSQSPSV